MNRTSPVRTWLQLLRAPNLLTVAGDPLAGFLLVGVAGLGRWTALGAAVAVGLCLYAAGLLFNDWFDRFEDARERPSRPIPAGSVRAPVVLSVGIALACAGMAVAAAAGRGLFTIAFALLLAIVFYNARAKHHPVGGPLTMGMCRGLNLLLGAAVVPVSFDVAIPALVAAAVHTAYIMAVTGIARRETETIRVGWRRWAPGTCLAVGFVLLHAMRGGGSVDPQRATAMLFAVYTVAWAFLPARALSGIPAPAVVGRTVGEWIRGIIRVQAAYCALCPPAGLVAAAVLLAVLPASTFLSRRFYSS